MISKGFWFCLLVAPMALAEPEVIADLGGKKTGLVSPSERLRAIASTQTVPALLAHQPMTGRYPMESSLRVGAIDTHAHDKPVNRPFFIVGYDQHSAEWLEANRKYLIEINARGLVTNVQSDQQMKKLREYSGDLPLDAIPVESIAAVFGLEFYPVLVTKDEVTQ